MTVHISRLAHSFGKTDVLQGVTLDFGPGIHGLLGRNGVGKSTLLKIIGGQLKPDSGMVKVFGERPFDNARVMDNTCLTGVDTAYPGSWSGTDVIKGAQLRYRTWNQALADELTADFEMGDALTRYHISLDVADRPGVLAQVATSFADHGVSIETVRQHIITVDPEGPDGTPAETRANLIVVTHTAPDAALAATVRALAGLDTVREVVSVMRVEGV